MCRTIHPFGREYRWQVEQILHFDKDRYRNGRAHFGFHDMLGNQYALSHADNWIACLRSDGQIRWTAGPVAVEGSQVHIDCVLKNPNYVTDTGDGSVLVTSGGNKRVYRIAPQERKASLFIDGEAWGLKDMGNCEYDGQGRFWINEITGCRVLRFDLDGQLRQILGTGFPGFQPAETSFNEVRFNWIYDLRRGANGNIYVLDSRNYAVRLIDMQTQSVKCVVGTGKSGYTGDGGDSRLATLGSDPSARFDGPWSLSVDEEENLFIGDTQNHVVRMVEKATNRISTIAGNSNIEPGKSSISSETHPHKLSLPLICSLDYYDGKLFIPEWNGDLVILSKTYPDHVSADC